MHKESNFKSVERLNDETFERMKTTSQKRISYYK